MVCVDLLVGERGLVGEVGVGIIAVAFLEERGAVCGVFGVGVVCEGGWGRRAGGIVEADGFGGWWGGGGAF